MKNDNKTKNMKKSNTADSAQKNFSYSNDMDESFFSYLADLKKLDEHAVQDKEDMIMQIDHTMNIFREHIFMLLPAVENFIQILEDLSAGEKLTKDDVFFPSSLQKTTANIDKKYFDDWKNELEKIISDLYGAHDDQEQQTIRKKLVCECCKIKVNYDYLDVFYNRISDYLTLWSEKDSLHISNYKKLIQSYTSEQKSFLADKFLFPAEMLDKHLYSLFETNKKLTELKHAVLRDHLRLVISIAQKFRNRGVSFNDIIQEGNMGLMRAIDKFDPHLGHKFSTYAVWWIKQNIIHSIAAQSRTIRIPAHMLSLINKINYAEQQLLQKFGREPDSAEIAQMLELSTAKVNAVRCMAQQAISLQAPVGNQSENFSLEDTLKDNSNAGDFTEFDRDVTYRMLYKLLKTLSQREQEIIILHFGLFGNKPTPFTELSERFNLTRERVRQLELKILNKLRAPDKLKLLDHDLSSIKKLRK